MAGLLFRLYRSPEYLNFHFESCFMDMQNMQKFNSQFSSKKIIPILGLVILTIGLIILFKNKKLDVLVEQQKTNLADFYTQNLKPILTGKQVTNEDIFNFAFYRELPVDKANHQYLQLGNEANGKEFFEFKNVSSVQKTNNLENFSNVLNLSPLQRKQVDSILNSYKGKIETQVLVNEKNTVAINANLWNLNRAIRTDLLLFASKANKGKFRQILPESVNFSDNPQIPRMVSDMKDADVNSYIFVTSDTIFSHPFRYEPPKVSEPPAKLKNNKGGQDREPGVRMQFNMELASKDQKRSHRDFKVYMDSSRFHIEVPDMDSMLGNMPSVEQINAQVEEATRLIKKFSSRMQPPVPPAGKMTNRIRMEFSDGIPDSAQHFELNIDIPDIDSIINVSLRIPKRLQILQESIDSLSEKQSHGSLSKSERAELREKLRELKSGFKKLRKGKSPPPVPSTESEDGD